ncbi:hypothetical protein L218DRAFT_958606 [Marasmius fiardii PR-910]|nr:hypothetical protein L218DRAFT_958606 [Marasmius fiardii PR-910]
MSTDATAPTTEPKNPSIDSQTVDASIEDKGKGKARQTTDNEDHPMDEDDDDEDDEDEDVDSDEEEDDDDEAEENAQGTEVIDPGRILSRRTRGRQVDYTSPEALAKAGLKKEELDEDEEMQD